MKKLLLRLLLSLGIAIFLTACSKDNYYKLEAAYYKNDYIKAGQLALKNQNYKDKKTQLFFKKNGEKFINKAIEKGATFTHQTVTKEQITYLEKLDVLLEEFRAVKLPIINIDHYLKQTEFYLNKAQKQFTKKSINSGNIAMTNLDYRKAYYHYEDALTYNSIDASIKTQKEIAFNHAKKEIVLAPFFNETPSINDQFKNLFQAILLKESLPEKVYKSQILIKGEDFLAKIHKETILMLNKKKSPFLSISLYKKKPTNIIVAGALSLIEDDRTSFPETEIRTGFIDYKPQDQNIDLWLTDSFNYEVITKRYQLNIKSELRFFQTNQKKPFHTQKFDDYASETQTTRGKIVSSLPDATEYKYPDDYQLLKSREQPFTKDYVLEEIIHTVSDTISNYIIELLDQ